MNQQIPGMDPHLAFVLPVFFLFFLTFSFLFALPYWFIFKKAGFSPWLALLMFVPLANIVLLYVLAFSRWNVVPAPEFAHAAYPGPYPGSIQPPPPGVPPLQS